MPDQNEKSFSSFLLEAMKMQGVSFEKLVETTGVSDRFLELLIEEDFEKLPASPYVHGYIMEIAEALNLDGQKLWQAYFKESDMVKKSGHSDMLPQNRFIASPRMRKKIVIGTVIIVVLVVIGYVLLRVQRSVGDPAFTINIGENTVTADTVFDVKGSVDPRDQISLNGIQLYPLTDGTFEKKIQLQSGFNTLSFKIKKFLGEEYTVNKQVFMEASSTSGKNEASQIISPSSTAPIQ